MILYIFLVYIAFKHLRASLLSGITVCTMQAKTYIKLFLKNEFRWGGGYKTLV